MKYLLMIFLIAGAGWYLYDLGATNTEIKNAKKDLGVITIEDTKNPNLEEDKEKNKPEIIEKEDNTKPSYLVEKLDDKNYLEIDDLLSKVENISDKIKITGRVLNSEIDKIIVKFSNNTSDFPNDSYQLRGFKKGNDTFAYNADSLVFQNLDYGENKYVIEAYVGDIKSVLELIITIPENVGEEENSIEKLDTEVSYNKKLIGEGDNALFIGLPESELFGKSLSLDSGKITYSNIKNLEISKQKLNKDFLDSNNIWKKDGTGYISKNDYWHIFRNIDYNNKDLGVSFFVLIKQDDKIIYEKHYLDFNHNLLGILKISEYDFEDYDKLNKLNTKLKEKEGDFEEVKKTDKLFKEIIR